MESPIGIINFLYHLVIEENKKRKADEAKKEKKKREEERQQKQRLQNGRLLNRIRRPPRPTNTVDSTSMPNMSYEDLEDELS